MYGQLKQDGRQAAGSCEKTGKSLCAGCVGKLPGLLSDSFGILEQGPAGAGTSQAVESGTILPGSNSLSAPGRNR